MIAGVHGPDSAGCIAMVFSCRSLMMLSMDLQSQ